VPYSDDVLRHRVRVAVRQVRDSDLPGRTVLTEGSLYSAQEVVEGAPPRVVQLDHQTAVQDEARHPALLKRRPHKSGIEASVNEEISGATNLSLHSFIGRRCTPYRLSEPALATNGLQPALGDGTG
jgi:hypothetical protein